MRDSFPDCCSASPAIGARTRLTARTTVSPIRRIGTSVGTAAWSLAEQLNASRLYRAGAGERMIGPRTQLTGSGLSNEMEGLDIPRASFGISLAQNPRMRRCVTTQCASWVGECFRKPKLSLATMLTLLRNWVRRPTPAIETGATATEERLGRRLSSKIFFASALVIVVLAGVSAVSLGALGRLVSVNREITTRAIPTLSLTASARDAIPPLVRLEARALVLGDR